MGNHKFRLSNIIPNAWFYKLKQMSNSSSNNNNKSIHTTTKPPNLDQVPDEAAAAAAVSIPTTPLQVMTISQSHPRKSYHFTRNLNAKSPPRKSSRKTRPTTKSSSSVSAACSCATVHSVRSKPPSTTTSSSLDNLSLPPELQCFDRMLAWSSTSCNCSSRSLVADDDVAAVIAVDNMSLAPETQETVISSVHLPPIKAQQKKFSDLVREIGAADQEEEEEIINDKPGKQRKSPVRRISTSSGSPRVRIRINSPRLSKRVESNGGRRKSVSRGHERVKSSESMAVVKSSADPERDFRESMVEMIVENEIRAAKDLEELLACYLSLNSAEYHHLIIQVFQQIWFDLNRIH